MRSEFVSPSYAGWDWNPKQRNSSECSNLRSRGRARLIPRISTKDGVEHLTGGASAEAPVRVSEGAGSEERGADGTSGDQTPAGDKSKSASPPWPWLKNRPGPSWTSRRVRWRTRCAYRSGANEDSTQCDPYHRSYRPFAVPHVQQAFGAADKCKSQLPLSGVERPSISCLQTSQKCHLQTYARALRIWHSQDG